MPQSYRSKRRKKQGGGDGREEQDAGEDGAPGGPQNKRQRKDEPARNDIWQEDGDFERKNDAYEAYYKRMAVCPEEDWPKLVEAYRTGLPVSIRVNRMRSGARSLCERLEEMRKECSEDPEREQYAPNHLTWYPHNSAWQWSGLERRTIKKDKRNAQLKEFLMHRERSGLLSRQETVSMIPPLFLCVEPHHWVLDLCAAPGSKTTQMIETMHWPEKASGGAQPSGFVMANELQWKRANMLAHQVARMGSPCSAVVNMDAQFYPEHWERTESGGYQLIKYDRILCDVPCSGDGTMRKTPYIWKTWNAKSGFSLHFRQLGILYRGLDLLKVGGRLVYSTCSLNPLEDESIVAAALQRHAGAVVLAPPPDMPGLKAADGLERWEVLDPESGIYYQAYEDVPQERKEDKCKMLPSMFPPPKTEEGAAISVSIRQNCRRMLPHLMDTGGFFVAAFEKIAECKPSAKNRREGKREQILAQRKADEEKQKQHGSNIAGEGEKAPPDAAASTEASAGSVDAATKETAVAKLDGEVGDVPAPVVEVAGAERTGPPAGLKPTTRDYASVKEDDESTWEDLVEYYGFEASMARRFLTRVKGAGEQKIFLISEGLERFMHSETKMPSRLVLLGVPVLKRAMTYHARACPWQLDQPGVLSAVAIGMKRVLTVQKGLLMQLLKEKDIPLADLRAAATAGTLSGLDALGGEDLRPGSVAVALEGTPCLLAVAAVLTEFMLELSVGKATEAIALLQELEGQPPVSEILRVPEGAVAEEADDDLAEAADVAEEDA